VEPDQGQVAVGLPEPRSRLQKLGTDQHRVEAADEEQGQDDDQVLDADDLVVGVHSKVAPHPGAGVFGRDRGRSTGNPGQRVVQEPEAAQPADQAERVSEQEGDVVLIRLIDEPVRRPGIGGVGAGKVGDQSAEQPAEDEPDAGQDKAAQQVESDEPSPSRPLHSRLSSDGRALHYPPLTWAGTGR